MGSSSSSSRWTSAIIGVLPIAPSLPGVCLSSKELAIATMRLILWGSISLTCCVFVGSIYIQCIGVMKEAIATHTQISSYLPTNHLFPHEVSQHFGASHAALSSVFSVQSMAVVALGGVAVFCTMQLIAAVWNPWREHEHQD